MRIKLDENMPARLAARLTELGYDVRTVAEEGIAGKTDPVVWEAAQREARFLITQDLDFSDARQLAPGTHHGILLVRLHAPTREALVARVEDVFAPANVTQWASCFVVATERKVRIRRPAKLP